jgi:hypothetical protein
VSDPEELLERRLRQVIEEEDSTGVHFFCQLGGRDDKLGMTTLQVSGSSGWTILGWRRGDEQKMFNYRLDWDIRQHFYQMIAEHPFWGRSPTNRSGEGEESNIHYRMSFQDDALYDAVHFWQNDMFAYPNLHELTRRIVSFINAISEEELPLIQCDEKV